MNRLPKVDQHNADRSARIQGRGQDIYMIPKVSVCNSENDVKHECTVVLSPECETSPPDQVLEDEPNHSPRNIIQRSRGWDKADTAEQDPEW